MVLTTMGTAPSGLPASRISTRIHQYRTSDADAHLFHHRCNKKIGFTAIYSAKSYIALKKDGAYVLIPSKKEGARINRAISMRRPKERWSKRFGAKPGLPAGADWI